MWRRAWRAPAAAVNAKGNWKKRHGFGQTVTSGPAACLQLHLGPPRPFPLHLGLAADPLRLNLAVPLNEPRCWQRGCAAQFGEAELGQSADPQAHRARPAAAAGPAGHGRAPSFQDAGEHQQALRRTWPLASAEEAHAQQPRQLLIQAHGFATQAGDPCRGEPAPRWHHPLRQHRPPWAHPQLAAAHLPLPATEVINSPLGSQRHTERQRR